MEIRFINTWNAPLDLLRESLCVKTAILIGNKVMLAGEPAHNISIEKEYPKLSMMEKFPT